MEATETLLREIDEEALRLEGCSLEEILTWGAQRFQRPALACSFGAEDVVLVDAIAHEQLPIDIFYLDTQLLFKETYQTRNRLVQRYGVRFLSFLPRLSLDEQAVQFGERLWERQPDQCCALRKVEPLRRALQGRQMWITGIRREQAPTRARARVVEWDAKNGLVKLNPLAAWTHKEVWDRIVARGIPYNPLHDRNYPSIGCWPCTTPIQPGEDPRAGRWRGTGKIECGIHQ